jgi:uncharacterized protein involved in tolerance to divalent cations
LNAADFKRVGVVSSTGTGICLVNLTVENEEKATRFVKELMSRALIAEAEVEENDFERQYLMFGTQHTDKGKTFLKLTTTDRRAPELVNYINQNSPNTYDYPVPDVTVTPISAANTKYVNWVKNQTLDSKAFTLPAADENENSLYGS